MSRKDFKFERNDIAWKLVAIRLNAFGETTSVVRDVDAVDMDIAGYISKEKYNNLVKEYNKLHGSYIASNTEGYYG